MKFQKDNMFRITSICFTILLLGVMSASITHAEATKNGSKGITVESFDVKLAMSEAMAFDKLVVVEGSNPDNEFQVLGLKIVDIDLTNHSLSNEGSSYISSIIAYSSNKKPIYMYTFGEPTGLIKEFIDFCLSTRGQEIVSEAGYIPVNSQAIKSIGNNGSTTPVVAHTSEITQSTDQNGTEATVLQTTEQTQNNSGNGSKKTPGFNVFCGIIALFIAVFLYRRN